MLGRCTTEPRPQGLTGVRKMLYCAPLYTHFLLPCSALFPWFSVRPSIAPFAVHEQDLSPYSSACPEKSSTGVLAQRQNMDPTWRSGLGRGLELSGMTRLGGEVRGGPRCCPQPSEGKRKSINRWYHLVTVFSLPHRAWSSVGFRD